MRDTAPSISGLSKQPLAEANCKRYEFFWFICNHPPELPIVPILVLSREAPPVFVWHGECKSCGTMKPKRVEQVEFIGGPEDGRVIDSRSLPLLKVAVGDDGTREIPMFVRLDDDFEVEEGDELELVLIGQYVCEPGEGERLKYRWLE